jgi:hypothetical protein
MAALTTVTVTSRSPATPLFGGQGSSATPIQVVNLDPDNTLYVGNTSNLAVGQPGVFPLEPLGSMSFDGSVTVYAITAAGLTVLAGVVPGGSNYSAGSLSISGPVTATISGPVDAVITGTTDVSVTNANIDVFGVGGFIAPGQVGNVFNSVASAVPPATTVQIANFLNVSTFASIVLSARNLSNSSVAAGAAVCAILTVQWLDSASNVVAVDVVSILLSPGNWQATWEMPVKGAAMALSVGQVGTVGTITIPAGNIYVDGAYRVVPNTRALQCLGGTAPTLTGCTVMLQGAPVYSIIGWVASIAYSWAGAIVNTVFPLPQWVGAVTGFYQDITTALARNATIVDLTYAVQGGVVSGSGYTGGIIVNIPGAIDTNPVPLTINLPPTQCALIIDSPAAAGEFFLSLVGVGN